ncbi:MAG TPA: rhomboid family intramembrane serine protease [Tahibacter sp.]|nr:rhomboid family intramembrane serine protease [Tahibacter sp.]
MNLPPVTLWLLIANLAVYALQQLFDVAMTVDFALWPFGERLLRDGGDIFTVGFAPWQLVTYGFMHGDIAHIALNMLGLVSFGPIVEKILGTRRFAIYWFVCLVVAALAQLAVVALGDGDFYPTVGASGAVYGLLAAGAMLFPREPLYLMFLPMPIQARTLALVMAGAELFHGVFGTLAGVAHFAHLGGMAGGIALIACWRIPPQEPSRPPPRRPSNYDRW